MSVGATGIRQVVALPRSARGNWWCFAASWTGCLPCGCVQCRGLVCCAADELAGYREDQKAHRLDRPRLRTLTMATRRAMTFWRIKPDDVVPWRTARFPGHAYAKPVDDLRVIVASE